MDKTRLFEFVNNELVKYDFRRKGSTWYRTEGDVIKVVNLQKSGYSNLYYVNLSTFFKALGDDEYPKENHCHVRTRLANEMVQSPNDYDYLFDLEHVTLSDDEYKREIQDCVENNIIPQLELIKSTHGIMDIAKKNPAFMNFIPITVRMYLGF